MFIYMNININLSEVTYAVSYGLGVCVSVLDREIDFKMHIL